MGISKLSLAGVVGLLALGLHATPAQALNLRSFISANGSDTNSCARTAPCRTLQVAHDKTAASGEINMLDPAGYGSVTITKAISIVNDGVGSAGILVASAATGITINAGPNDAINIRGLVIEGTGEGKNGIVFNTGASLVVTNCVIRGLSLRGIYFNSNAAGTLVVSNTLVTNTYIGIDVSPTGSGLVTGTLSRVELDNNAFGLYVDGNSSTGTIAVVAVDSVAADNSVHGFGVFSSVAAARLTVIRSVSAHNGTGLRADASAATLRVGQSTMMGNNVSWLATRNAVLRSYQDNNIDGNNDGDPAPTTIAKK